MRRLFVLIGLVIGAALFAVPHTEVEAFNFQVHPSRTTIDVPAGKRRGQTLTIDNSQSSEDQHFTIYVRDVIHLPNNEQEFPEPGSTERSCANWITITPSELDVRAGEIVDVRLSVLAPEGATGGYYAIVFTETEPALEAEGRIGINYRVGSIVEVVVPGTEVREAKLANINYDPEEKKVGVQIFNQGNILVRPTGLLKLLDASGKKVAQMEFNKQGLGILPKLSRTIDVPLSEDVAPGKYKLRTEIDYGARYLLVGELPVTVN